MSHHAAVSPPHSQPPLAPALMEGSGTTVRRATPPGMSVILIPVGPSGELGREEGRGRGRLERAIRGRGREDDGTDPYQGREQGWQEREGELKRA